MNVSIPSVMALRNMNDDEPTMEFSTEDVPELKDWKVGEQYKLQVTVTLVKSELDEESDKEEGEDYESNDDSNEIWGNFNVDEIKVIK
jgi:hypothetical protein